MSSQSTQLSVLLATFVEGPQSCLLTPISSLPDFTCYFQADLPRSVKPRKMVDMNNAASIPIENLSKTEKIVLMERLWVDLSRCPSELDSPDWHGDVLAERLSAVADGKAEFVDWDEAKERLRARLK